MTIPGHVTIYRHAPEGFPAHGTRAFERLAGSRVGIWRPETFGPSRAPISTVGRLSDVMSKEK
jgi:hypothetical protein